MTVTLQPGDLLTVPQALKLVPIGRSTLYRLVESGQLAHYRLDATGRRKGRILVRRADLDELLEKCHQPARRRSRAVDVDAIRDRVRRRFRSDGNSP